ncbi:MAG: hypothetical protein M1821_005090 [Bathelium mastoideum]|nr:MAG: hypothetical protein M1821_005090 [Bathelium mastoideum]
MTDRLEWIFAPVVDVVLSMMEETPTTPPIHHHSPFHPSPLLALLQPVLPAGLPLCRRLRFPFRSGYEFVLTTFPPETKSLPRVFAIAFCDRSRRPEAECYLFSSLELHDPTLNHVIPSTSAELVKDQNGAALAGPADRAMAVAQIRALLHAVLALPAVPSADDPAYDAQRGAAVLAARTRAIEQGMPDPLLHASSPLKAAAPAAAAAAALNASGEEDEPAAAAEVWQRERHYVKIGAVHDVVTSVLRDDLGLLPREDWGSEGVWADGFRSWWFDGRDVAGRVSALAAITNSSSLDSSASTAVRSSSVNVATSVVESIAEATKDPEPKFFSTHGLTPGLYWSALRETDLALVRSRTSIPRRERTMRMLPAVCVRRLPDDSAGASEDRASRVEHEKERSGVPAPPGAHEPVAWAFLGTEGGLSTLHVEPAFRGKGLAKTVAGRLLVDGLERAYGAEEPWAHSEVAEENVASVGVMRALGARKGSLMWWLRVDLRRL